MGRIIYILLVAASITLLSLPAFAQERTGGTREPDSEYVKSKQKPKKNDGGSLFGFLPFVGGRSKESVSSENLVPGPLPQESKPVLSKEKMEQLQTVADRWLLTSEFTEPTLRQDMESGYYRDYVVFSSEYRVEVLRGDAENNPFVGHVYVKGDYFRTEAHDNSDDAESDFSFKYQPREFRLVFDRVEKWDYSDDPHEAPFTFTERWEFRRLQSRSTVDFSEGAGLSDKRSATEERDETPEQPGD